VARVGGSRRTSRLAAAVGLLLSVMFALYAVRGLDPAALSAALRSQRYVFLLPAGLALAVAVALRAWRWQLLFPRSSRPAFGHVGGALLVGYLFNTILPARAGEAARVHVLGRRSGTSRAQVLATVVVERAFDLVVLVALLVLATPLLPPIGWLPAAVAVGVAASVVLVAVAAVGVRSGGGAVARLLRPLERLPGVDEARVTSMADAAVAGLAGVRTVGAAAAAVAVTAASWLALAASTWLLLLGTDLDLGLGAALLVVVATNLILVVPSSPAAIGSFEAAAVLALSAHGADRAEALSFALVLHALNALPYIPLGYAALALHSRAMRRRDTGAEALES